MTSRKKDPPPIPPLPQGMNDTERLMQEGFQDRAALVDAEAQGLATQRPPIGGPKPRSGFEFLPLRAPAQSQSRKRGKRSQPDIFFYTTHYVLHSLQQRIVMDIAKAKAMGIERDGSDIVNEALFAYYSAMDEEPV